jgi:hypothetical protein
LLTDWTEKPSTTTRERTDRLGLITSQADPAIPVASARLPPRGSIPDTGSERLREKKERRKVEEGGGGKKRSKRADHLSHRAVVKQDIRRRLREETVMTLTR